MPEIDVSRKKEKYMRSLANAYTLPALPFIIEEVNRVIDNPKASAAHLGDVISKDQALVAKILSVANSPLYGIPRRVSTIDFAIIILGFNHIKNIVIAFSLMDSISSFDSTVFDRQRYWIHSLMTATASKRIAEDLGFHVSGEAFTAGLLHDLGIPIICKHFPKEFKQIQELVLTKGMHFREAEIEVLGMDHQEVGRILVERWNLPPSLSEVVAFHHQPSLATEYKSLSALVHLTDYMTNRFVEETNLWDDFYLLDMSILETLRLGNTEYLEAFIDSYRTQFQDQIETLTAF
jgi:putative nucleotidyltransferase with HDIG domain